MSDVTGAAIRCKVPPVAFLATPGELLAADGGGLPEQGPPVPIRRRRPTTGAAQAKRVAWGREWGGEVKSYWQQLKARKGGRR